MSDDALIELNREWPGDPIRYDDYNEDEGSNKKSSSIAHRKRHEHHMPRIDDEVPPMELNEQIYNNVPREVDISFRIHLINKQLLYRDDLTQK